MEDYSSKMYETKYHADPDLSKLNFLITGGAGFIGSNLAEYLLKYNAGKVRVLDNFSTGLKKNIEPFLSHPKFEFIEGDIRDYDMCIKAVDDIDYISHQAALGSVPRSVNDPITTNSVNISGFLNMLTAAKNSTSLKQMVYASSSSVYGNSPLLPKKEENTGAPLSPYAVTKHVNELYADVYSRVYNFNTIGLRYFNVFGPKQSPEGAYAAVIPLFIKSVLNNVPCFINGDGETSRDFTFIENVVQANIKAMLTKGLAKHEAINIAFGERITLNELWSIINKLSGLDIKPAYREERKGDVKHSLADVSKAENLINYTPKFSVMMGLKSAIEWYKVTHE
jgi:UDP-N-acetylglucosamine/UDP-N-acetyl-alpha-D-glucosaminouronate 4-epimerase